MGKHERLVLKQAPEHAQDLHDFSVTIGLEYRGQSLATCVELALQMLLKQKRQPTQAGRTETYKTQDGKCSHCACELDGCEEFDHVLPVRDATTGTEVKWRAVCRECHALLTERDATRRNPLLSSFTPHLYEAFCNSPKPVPCTILANAIDRRVPLIHLDFKRCRASILRYSPWEWVAATSADGLVYARERLLPGLHWLSLIHI